MANLLRNKNVYKGWAHSSVRKCKVRNSIEENSSWPKNGLGQSKSVDGINKYVIWSTFNKWNLVKSKKETSEDNVYFYDVGIYITKQLCISYISYISRLLNVLFTFHFWRREANEYFKIRNCVFVIWPPFVNLNCQKYKYFNALIVGDCKQILIVMVCVEPGVSLRTDIVCKLIVRRDDQEFFITIFKFPFVCVLGFYLMVIFFIVFLSILRPRKDISKVRYFIESQSKSINLYLLNLITIMTHCNEYNFACKYPWK